MKMEIRSFSNTTVVFGMVASNVSLGTVNPVNQMTMADIYQRTLEKKHYLEGLGFSYISTWEWKFDREILDNLYIKSFVSNVSYVTPLETRDAFAGGRTEAFKLYHEVKIGESINYYDVTSLYHYINKAGKAVLGHPHGNNRELWRYFRI